MENSFSQLSRMGTLKGRVMRGTLAQADGNPGIPFISFSMVSSFSIGLGETVEEPTNVVIYGPATQWWDSAYPDPQEGDIVLIHGATTYVKKGTLCCRSQVPGQVVLMRQPAQEYVNADEYFQKLWQEAQPGK